MNLYLVQHGEAKDKAEDPSRPLSDIGAGNTERVAQFLSQNMTLKIEKVFHSGKARAQQTAQIMAGHFHPVRGLDATDGLNPLDDPTVWAKRINDMTEDIMLVGHGPHLKRLVSLLTGGDSERDVIELRNAGVFCLNRSETGNWAIRWIIIPDMVR
ncbi:MAG: phosphohistidine phosphatase SixA [Candidatus Zixiibacteriota bacterium]|nr:MAG: phosphohistidine phosphatase SixA [candidate division Zixibacteria bacterium]